MCVCVCVCVCACVCVKKEREKERERERERKRERLGAHRGLRDDVAAVQQRLAKRHKKVFGRCEGLTELERGRAGFHARRRMQNTHRQTDRQTDRSRHRH